MSDCLFFRDVFDAYEKHQNDVYLALLLLCAVFLGIPYFCNVGSALADAKKMEEKFAENPAAIVWFDVYRKKFAWFVALSGGIYPTIALCNSRVFGLDIFMMSLSKREVMAFDVYKLKYSVALENIPQIILQLIYAGVNPSEASKTVSFYLAMASSILSVLSAVLNYTINLSMPTKHERFTLTIKHGADSSVNEKYKKTKTDRAKLETRKYRFKCIWREMVRAFQTSEDKLEIVAISHYAGHTEVCMDFIGDTHKSLSDRYVTEKKAVDEAIHRAFQLNFVYKCEFRVNLKRWEMEKMRFVHKYAKMENEESENLEFEGEKWRLNVEFLGKDSQKDAGKMLEMAVVYPTPANSELQPFLRIPSDEICSGAEPSGKEEEASDGIVAAPNEKSLGNSSDDGRQVVEGIEV